MKPGDTPKTWSDLAEVRKPSLFLVVVFGFGAAVYLFLAYDTGRLLFRVLFVAAFIACALELRRWLRRRKVRERLVTRNYTERDYQALGIAASKKEGRTRSQKVVGMMITMASYALTIYLFTTGEELKAPGILGSSLPLMMILLDHNRTRFTWGEIKGQWFRLTVYVLSMALFLYQVLAALGLVSLQNFFQAHMHDTQLDVELFLGVAFFPLLLLNIAFTIRDTNRRMYGRPL